jgi:hypothetical protein
MPTTTQIRQIFREEINQSNDALKKELKNDILQFKDDILGEIVKLREEVAVVNGYRDKIENHEERLEAIETELNTTPA